MQKNEKCLTWAGLFRGKLAYDSLCGDNYCVRERISYVSKFLCLDHLLHLPLSGSADNWRYEVAQCVGHYTTSAVQAVAAESEFAIMWVGLLIGGPRAYGTHQEVERGNVSMQWTNDKGGMLQDIMALWHQKEKKWVIAFPFLGCCSQSSLVDLELCDFRQISY